MFVEEWSDREALAAHFAVPGSLAFVAGMRGLAALPLQIRVYDAEPVKVRSIETRCDASSSAAERNGE